MFRKALLFVALSLPVKAKEGWMLVIEKEN